jgi:hypothetical protein
MIDYFPEWMTYEIEQALRGLTRKQRTTVLKLAEAAATPDRTMSDVFREPDCCNRSTWYDRPSKAGWESDPQIKHALALATERAQHWADTSIARHIATAQRKLAQASPPAVDRVISLMAGAQDERIQLRAAESILDRTAQETASKTPPSPQGERTINFNGLSDEELRAIIAGRSGAGTGGEDASA